MQIAAAASVTISYQVNPHYMQSLVNVHQVFF